MKKGSKSYSKFYLPQDLALSRICYGYGKNIYKMDEIGKRKMTNFANGANIKLGHCLNGVEDIMQTLSLVNGVIDEDL